MLSAERKGCWLRWHKPELRSEDKETELACLGVGNSPALSDSAVLGMGTCSTGSWLEQSVLQVCLYLSWSALHINPAPRLGQGACSAFILHS